MTRSGWRNCIICVTARYGGTLNTACAIAATSGVNRSIVPPNVILTGIWNRTPRYGCRCSGRRTRTALIARWRGLNGYRRAADLSKPRYSAFQHLDAKGVGVSGSIETRRRGSSCREVKGYRTAGSYAANRHSGLPQTPIRVVLRSLKAH